MGALNKPLNILNLKKWTFLLAIFKIIFLDLCRKRLNSIMENVIIVLGVSVPSNSQPFRFWICVYVERPVQSRGAPTPFAWTRMGLLLCTGCYKYCTSFFSKWNRLVQNSAYLVQILWFRYDFWIKLACNESGYGTCCYCFQINKMPCMMLLSSNDVRLHW